jgi:hypothetical protein
VVQSLRNNTLLTTAALTGGSSQPLNNVERAILPQRVEHLELSCENVQKSSTTTTDSAQELDTEIGKDLQELDLSGSFAVSVVIEGLDGAATPGDHQKAVWFLVNYHWTSLNLEDVSAGWATGKGTNLHCNFNAPYLSPNVGPITRNKAKKFDSHGILNSASSCGLKRDFPKDVDTQELDLVGSFSVPVVVEGPDGLEIPGKHGHVWLVQGNQPNLVGLNESVPAGLAGQDTRASQCFITSDQARKPVGQTTGTQHDKHLQTWDSEFQGVPEATSNSSPHREFPYVDVDQERDLSGTVLIGNSDGVISPGNSGSPLSPLQCEYAVSY